MLLLRLAGDQNIVDVDEYTRYVAENFVHQTLEILSSVFKTEGRSREYK